MMSNVKATKARTICEGSQTFLIGTEGLSSLKLPHELFQNKNEKGNLLLFLEEGYRLKVDFNLSNGLAYSLTTLPFELPEFPDVFIIITWKDEIAKILVHDTWIASTDSSLQVPSKMVTGKTQISLPPFYSQAEEILAKRIKKEKERSVDASKKAKDVQELREQLRKAQIRLKHYCEAAKKNEDSDAFIPALANDLRGLVSKTTVGESLLQRMSGHACCHLIVYALPQIAHLESMEASLEDNIRIAPRYVADTAMDIDEWLDITGMYLGKTAYSNEQILKHIANDDGSHFDPHERPLVEFLKSIFAQKRAWRDVYLLSLAEVVISLNERVLQKV